MKIPVVFLCGDRSPYGIAHLESINDQFDLRAVIIADKARWNIFRRALAGGDSFPEPNLHGPLVRFKKLFSRPVSRQVSEVRRSRVLRRAKVPIHVVHDVNNPEVHDLLRQYGPELLLSAAYPQIFKETLLEVASRGAVNFHPSALPRCRGAHPHYWCLASGEKIGGITAHFMTERIDNGDIVAQRSFDLDGLYYAELYRRILEETPRLVRSVAEFLQDPLAQAKPQDEVRVTYFRNDRLIHHRLDWSLMPAVKLHNLIRAGGAFTHFHGRRIFIDRARIVECNRHMTNGVVVSPGVIVDIDDIGGVVATRDGRFLVLEELTDGGRPMNFPGWVNKNRVHIADRFE